MCGLSELSFGKSLQDKVFWNRNLFTITDPFPDMDAVEAAMAVVHENLRLKVELESSFFDRIRFQSRVTHY